MGVRDQAPGDPAEESSHHSPPPETDAPPEPASRTIYNDDVPPGARLLHPWSQRCSQGTKSQLCNLPKSLCKNK